jgi:opacity protein-like surface antigen
MKELLVAGVSLMALLVASRADAADPLLPIPVKAAPAPTAYDWTGFYVGGHIG